MKKVLTLSICTLFFLTSLTIIVNANIISITSNGNTPPNPPVINGPSSGKIKKTYTYDVTVSDPDEDDLLILVEINFSDGITACGGCDGRGPWHSGDVVDFDHSWTKIGTFNITGRVKDEHGEWSERSDPLPITMPYSYEKPILPFLKLLFQRFPNAFLLLQHLVGY
jgi:hypothetical protein